MESLTALITGASQGLGFEFTQQLLKQNYRVIATCRHLTQAQALKKLAENEPKLTLCELDVTDPKLINTLQSTLQDQSIDRLILNAGIAGADGVTIGNIDTNNFQKVFATNTFAPICILNALHPLVARSQQKQVLVISSKMGSISDNRSGKSYAYRSSKTALNAIMHSAAIDLLPTKIQILLLHPGWVKTNMTGPQAPLDSNQSVTGMLQVADNATDIPSGAFLDYQGNSIPW